MFVCAERERVEEMDAAEATAEKRAENCGYTAARGGFVLLLLLMLMLFLLLLLLEEGQELLDGGLRIRCGSCGGRGGE